MSQNHKFRFIALSSSVCFRRRNGGNVLDTAAATAADAADDADSS